MRQDLAYAVRMLRRSPAVTAVAALSLALAIGANTAIFTLIESTLLRPIAVMHLDRLPVGRIDLAAAPAAFDHEG